MSSLYFAQEKCDVVLTAEQIINMAERLLTEGVLLDNYYVADNFRVIDKAMEAIGSEYRAGYTNNVSFAEFAMMETDTEWIGADGNNYEGKHFVSGNKHGGITYDPDPSLIDKIIFKNDFSVKWYGFWYLGRR